MTEDTTPVPVHEALAAVVAAVVGVKAARAAETAARRELTLALAVSRTRRHDAEDGSQCWVSQPGPRVVVSNETAYRGWVRAQHPDVMVEVVASVWQAAHLTIGKGVDVTPDGGEVVDTATGEVVPGVTVLPPGTPTLTVKAGKGGPS